ncbi:hypothetical protein [Peterkaempfera griseoplana]|uniref:hypothetical protein n=1 Tax=Peterkaempfera griseoplana TaxID=66896 RepID=UPI0006E2B724|nr:hypothetical protein [Peterkaempfera griseoplana]
MATGPQHYTEAESFLRACTTSDGALIVGEDTHVLLAAAQVHATLALAAATATAAPLDGEADSGMPPADAKAWYAAVGANAQATTAGEG